MEQAQHTPGPWSAAVANVSNRYRYIFGGQRLICRVTKADDEADANTHLIEAAPDVLEALISLADDMSERFDLNSPSTNPGIKQCIKEARAAIARAAGQGE